MSPRPRRSDTRSEQGLAGPAAPRLGALQVGSLLRVVLLAVAAATLALWAAWSASTAGRDRRTEPSPRPATAGPGPPGIEVEVVE